MDETERIDDERDNPNIEPDVHIICKGCGEVLSIVERPNRICFCGKEN